MEHPMNETYEIHHRLHEAEAGLNYALHVFGGHLAEREGYRAHSGMDAVHYYICLKHHWTPAVVRAMHPNDLRFLLEEEMHGWTLPPEARPAR
jgi:hypothetical protein